MKRCIYCNRVLDADTHRAHVFPLSLGGRITSARSNCNECNNSFTSIESDAARRIALMAALAGARRGDNTLIETTTEHEGKRYRVAGARMDGMGGRPRDRGTKFPMPARRDDQARVVAGALRSRNLPAEAMLDGRFRLELDEDDTPPPPIQADPIWVTLRWFDTASKRLMSKMALELLAYFDPPLAARDELRAARRFARYGEGDAWANVDTETSGAGLPLATADLIHGIEVWTHGTRVSYRLILFTELKFVGTLTDVWSGPPFRASYTFDALAPEPCTVNFESASGAPLVRKSSRVCRAEFDAAAARYEATSLARSERRWVRAPAPSFEDLYPDVLREMTRS